MLGTVIKSIAIMFGISAIVGFFGFVTWLMFLMPFWLALFGTMAVCGFLAFCIIDKAVTQLTNDGIIKD